ncbi:MAG: inorganic phosphate transporter [Chloroflexota bacterium]
MLWLLIILALIFAFINGLRDSSSIMAGVIASRAQTPRLARTLCGLAELVAPFLFGVAVARSLTTGLVNPQMVTLDAITAAMAAALVWTVFAWLRGIPSSSSHALVGGILGAALMAGGSKAIVTGGLLKVVFPLFLAPIIGLGAGYVAMQIAVLACWNATPGVNRLLQRLQIGTMLALALSHSANDAQKSMGVITLGLLLSGKLAAFAVPLPVVALCAAAIALGASRGDWRLIRTLGRKIYTIRPINALASQSASAAVIMLSAALGAPVSTSQVISMALLGAGAAERPNKVRWQVGGEMLVTWFLTMPATMLIAALLIAITRGAVL